MKSIKYFILVFISLMIIIPGASFAGGGGGGGLCPGGGGGGGGDGQRSEPRYHTYEDLRSGVGNETFYFQNDNKPTSALVSLGYFLTYPSCAAKNKKVAALVSSKPSSYKINNMRISTYWNDNIEIAVNWSDIARLSSRADLIFTRGNGKGPDIVKYFSNWTHIAIIDDPGRKLVFEATPNNNVNTIDAQKNWNHITYYTCKQIETMPYSYRLYCLDLAKTKYTGLPYFPQVGSYVDLVTFVLKWSDKNDLSSMYCSKLVYNTFKPNINMNSGRTSVMNPRLQKADGDYMFSWIGVSPDNIYFSPALGPDFAYSQNVLNL